MSEQNKVYSIEGKKTKTNQTTNHKQVKFQTKVHITKMHQVCRFKNKQLPVLVPYCHLYTKQSFFGIGVTYFKLNKFTIYKIVKRLEKNEELFRVSNIQKQVGSLCIALHIKLYVALQEEGNLNQEASQIWDMKNKQTVIKH